MTDILVNKVLFIIMFIMFIAYQARDLDVLTGSTEKINFQKDMGLDMMHKFALLMSVFLWII